MGGNIGSAAGSEPTTHTGRAVSGRVCPPTSNPQAGNALTSYHFITELAVAAPVGDVYDTLVQPEWWLDRWSDATAVRRVKEGDPSGVGTRFDAEVRAPLGYRLRAQIETVEADRPSHLRMTASGDVEGTGVWELAHADGLTHVTFTWAVRTTPAWMNALAPIARPLFERSHHAVVRHAAEAAAAHLDAELVRVESRSIHPAQDPSTLG